MNSIFQSKIFNINFNKKNPLFLSYLPFLQLPLAQKNQNYPKYNAINEIEENKELNYISKKRGRKKKLQENINNINQDEKVHNKFSSDNMKKKLKTLFHNYMIDLLNNLMKEHFKENRMKFIKVNSRITKDINIEYNRNLFNKKIKDIIIDESNKYKNRNNNKECIKYIETQKDNENIIKILNTTYKTLFIEYYLNNFKSNKYNVKSFEEHKEKLLKEYGKEYLDKFIENANNFIQFFENGKNRKSKKMKKIEFVTNNSESELLETNNSKEITCFNNNEKYYSKKDMVSSSTQTDICNINTKIIIID